MIGHCLEGRTHEVGVTGVNDAHNTDSVELSGSSSELDVGALVVVHGSLGAMWRKPNDSE